MAQIENRSWVPILCCCRLFWKINPKAPFCRFNEIKPQPKCFLLPRKTKNPKLNRQTRETQKPQPDETRLLFLLCSLPSRWSPSSPEFLFCSPDALPSPPRVFSLLYSCSTLLCCSRAVATVLPVVVW